MERVGCEGALEYGDVFSARVDAEGEIDYSRCGAVDVQRALAHIDGPTKPVWDGPPVAVATGYYGDHNLVAVNSLGRPVAWGGVPQPPHQMAVCPGGRTVVVESSAPDGRGRVDIIDAATVQSRRTVLASRGAGFGSEGIACGDEEGNQLAFFSSRIVGGGADGSGVPKAQVTRVRGHEVTTVDLRDGVYDSVAATGDGFLVSRRIGESGYQLLRIDSSGREFELERYPQFEYLATFALSGDGRTLAAIAQRAEGTDLVLLDAGTGEVAHRKDLYGESGPFRRGVAGIQRLGWTPDGHLLASVETDTDGGPTRTPPDMVLEFDGLLRVVGERSAGPGGQMKVVGNSAVVLVSGRPTYVNSNLLPRELDVRLTYTRDLVGLSGVGMGDGPDSPAVSTTRPGRVAALFLAGIAATLAAAGGMRLLRSRPVDLAGRD